MENVRAQRSQGLYSTLGSSITEAFRIDLTQSPVLRVAEGNEVNSTLRLMGRDGTLPLSEESAHGVAARIGAKAVLVGDVAPLGSGYVLSARLIGNFGAQAEIDVHGRLYGNSELQPLTNIGAPVSFGVFYAPAHRARIDLRVQEDASVYVSPDFVLNLTVATP